MLNLIKSEVVGIRPYSFTDSQGRVVDMYQLYGTFPRKDVEGIACFSCAISSRRFLDDGLKLGSFISVALVDKKWQYAGVVK